MNPYLSVIVPAYNEERRIRDCLDGLTAYLWNYTHYQFEIIVVDNGSTDGTAGIVAEWQEHWPQIIYIRVDLRGKGRAIKTGMLMARGEYRYMADVDLACSSFEIPRFLISVQCGNHDVVIGSRMMARLSPMRWIYHHAFQALTRLIVPGIHDTQCGFKMFRADAAKKIFTEVQTTGLAFDVEVLYIARRRGFRICEMPVEWHEKSGSVIDPVRDGMAMIRELLAILSRKTSSPIAIPAETRQP